MYQVFAQIQGYMFFSVLHVCIIEIDFGFFLLDLNLMLTVLLATTIGAPGKQHVVFRLKPTKMSLTT
ncbi:hypothetical protein Bca4012_008062 [Brassica carinata]